MKCKKTGYNVITLLFENHMPLEFLEESTGSGSPGVKYLKHNERGHCLLSP